MEKVLITGATGLIGKALVARLLREGCHVHALTRNVALARQRLPVGVEILEWGFSQHPSPALPGNLSAVVHLAGESLAHWPWSESRKKILWNSRVKPTRSLVEALERMKCKPSVLISASGMGYYGDAGNREVRIGDPPGKDFLGQLAAAWEGEALKAQNFGMRVVLPRFGMVLSSHGGALPKMALPFRFGFGAVLGSGNQYWSWIHLDDAVDLLFRIIKDERFQGPVHAVAGPPLMQKEFARILAEKFGTPLWFRIPIPGLRLVLGEMADLFLHGQRAGFNPDVFSPGISSLENALRITLG